MHTGSATCEAGLTASSNGSWYTGLRDTRACTQCQCGFGISKCTGGVIQAYSGAGCTGSVA
ncbi:MAG TPA: hypothetical protein VG937_20335, partial [Polyangiaceae bacterium]|nr:hypothetical protein [Polyangiaceae bacterium]